MTSYAVNSVVKKGNIQPINSIFGMGMGGSGKKVNIVIRPSAFSSKRLTKPDDLRSICSSESLQGRAKIDEAIVASAAALLPSETSQGMEIEGEADDDDEFVDAVEENIFERMIQLSNKIEIGPNRFYVKIHVKYLLHGIDTSIIKYNMENRLVSEERLKHFRDFDIYQSDPIILGKNLSGSTYDIIDGQHRVEILRGDIDKYANEMIMMDIRLYHDEKAYYKILDIVNDRFNFDHSMLKRFKCAEIKDLLVEYCRKRKCVTFGERRPYLNQERFQQELVKTALFNKVETKGADVFAKLLEVNQFLSTAMVGISEKALSATMKASFDKTGLYLALDKSYASIQLLDVPKEKFAEAWKSLRKTW